MEDLFGAFDGEAELGEHEDFDNDEEDTVVKKKIEEKVGNQARNGNQGNLEPAKSDKVAVVERKREVEDVVQGDVKRQKTETNSIKKHSEPAKTYPFELDGFQKEAIGYLEKNESVLVAAHTSAGKTVCAEYAIAMALRDKQRVIYTSPIKALSNQKYRDLVEEFSDVGLMTGDVTINPNASCLVMTTEILRSMLYRGSEVIREVAYAVFDEVHYMRDRERGVVWEESIVLLPHKVRYVFLSATIPNAQQFCDWISKIHHQPCHAVYTDYRPTPLQHYIYPAGSTGVYLIVDEKGKFHDDTFQKAMATMNQTALEDEVRGGPSTSAEARKAMNAKRRNKLGDLMSIVQMIMQRNYDPAIVFSFSKKDCEKYAAQVSKLNFNSDEDKAVVNQVFKNAIDSLNDDDKNLPQVRSLLPLLEKGIGIHHGGLLPILKEVTEILFGEGLIKILFATETFAMGINMPAKTVVFTAMRKFDGTDFRWVSPGEYIQMSGRAGRRGLDTRGIVIQMMEEPMENTDAKEIMSGQANPLSSTFHLGYNMLLNLMRVEDADPEFIIRNSLYTFQQENMLPKLEEELKVTEEELTEAKVEREDELAQFHRLRSLVEKNETSLNNLVMTPERISGFIRAGRLVSIADGWGWCVALQMIRPISGRDTAESVQVVTACDPKCTAANPRPYAGGETPPMLMLRNFPIAKVVTVSSLRVHTQQKVGNTYPLDSMYRSLQEVKRRFKGVIPVLDPIKDMSITDPALPPLIEKLQRLRDDLSKDNIENMKDEEARTTLYAAFLKKFKLRNKVKMIKNDIKQKKKLPMKEKLKSMNTVLRRLGHIDKDNVIQLKGRVACEISTADELVITELLLGGKFNGLTPPQAAALLSCVVYGEGGANDDDEVPIPQEMTQAFRTMQAAAKHIAQVQTDANIPTDPDEYVKKFKPDLIEPVLKWCQGAMFAEICGLTKVFEGSIIRCVRRLVELLRQLCVAARVIGDASLEQIFFKAIELIKRDIIFAASLYL
mmetsp:Transcript_9153/g.17264  ORF Transcript_9153/g.17264 Transcript_9153/m.17264 type:complete len:1005 (+) Transcript_9153:245-3259(+)|eukprot:CAMPEP_0203765220 /NCGR_PEP_ID=MMETSP0098-20131031/18293_1 /ASSEMBLY_ACC=CAM_ASM_000208 /TAXON_ID=96639 /ORGANISM=" , Strain NY0313808BC1" /LENGTH=1004 /DNA_ID=CAMNT_0050661453 /DNA_START=510 /DNA_END=3524 /DNA_ORIENTATION=+